MRTQSVFALKKSSIVWDNTSIWRNGALSLQFQKRTQHENVQKCGFSNGIATVNAAIDRTFASDPSALEMSAHAAGWFGINAGVVNEVVQKEGVAFFVENGLDLAGKDCGLLGFVK